MADKRATAETGAGAVAASPQQQLPKYVKQVLRSLNREGMHSYLTGMHRQKVASYGQGALLLFVTVQKDRPKPDIEIKHMGLDTIRSQFPNIHHHVVQCLSERPHRVPCFIMMNQPSQAKQIAK